VDVEKHLCVCVPACCQQARRKSHAPPPSIPCVCVCVCVCLIVHVHVCMCACVHECMSACVHVCMCACACVCARMKPAYRTYIHAWTHEPFAACEKLNNLKTKEFLNPKPLWIQLLFVAYVSTCACVCVRAYRYLTPAIEFGVKV
jgi:hypothetical protein